MVITICVLTSSVWGPLFPHRLAPEPLALPVISPGHVSGPLAQLLSVSFQSCPFLGLQWRSFSFLVLLLTPYSTGPADIFSSHPGWHYLDLAQPGHLPSPWDSVGRQGSQASWPTSWDNWSGLLVSTGGLWKTCPCTVYRVLSKILNGFFFFLLRLKDE